MMQGDDGRQKGFKKAREKWLGGYHSYGECEDLYFSFRYGDQTPFDQQFEDLALTIFQPLFEHLVEEEGA